MKDGLFKLPYTMHDWIVVAFAIAGTILRIGMMCRNNDTRNPSWEDWLVITAISFILTSGLYELAIYKDWRIEVLYLPFALIIVLSKDIFDWALMSPDGREFVLQTVKSIISSFARKLLNYAEKTNDSIDPDSSGV